MTKDPKYFLFVGRKQKAVADILQFFLAKITKDTKSNALQLKFHLLTNHTNEVLHRDF